MRIIKLTLACLQIAILLTCPQESSADPLITYPLRIKNYDIRAEIANTEPERLRGLMFRDKLPENGGMIFLYPHAQISAMWMKNTKIALSVAFIDSNGRILNVADMQPLSERAHVSAGAAAYALEMKHGWFKKRGIKAGNIVEGLENLPLPQ